MLGKQGWKIATDNDAIVSRVFKAKYFPKGDFLGARLGHNPSFVWHSIHTSRVVVKLGLRWRIGDGQDINIWSQPWLRSEGNSCVTSNPTAGTEDWSVAKLIDNDAHCWCTQLVRSLFNPVDVQQILKIPIPCVQSADKPIWKLSRSGIYTVKSAYYGVMGNLIDNSYLRYPGDWKLIWKLRIPPKVKLLVWRVLRGVLPTRVRLQTKGVNCPSFCQHCEIGEENEWHVFMDCEKAVKCWEAAGLFSLVSAYIPQAADFTDLIFKLLPNAEQQQKHKIAMLMWALWRGRNEKIWTNEDIDASRSVTSAMNMLRDWELAKLDRGSNQNTTTSVQQLRWSKPNSGCLKVNVDAATFGDINSFGIGICARNHLGEFVQAKTICIPGVVPALEAEARGLWEAISWMGELGYQNIIFELDCKSVVDTLMRNSNCQTEAATIIRNCKEKLTHYQTIRLVSLGDKQMLLLTL